MCSHTAGPHRVVICALIHAAAVLPHFHKSFKHPRMTVPRSTAVVLLLASALLLAPAVEANIWSDIGSVFSGAWRVGDGVAACAAAACRHPPAAGRITASAHPTLGCRQKTREVFTNAAT